MRPDQIPTAALPGRCLATVMTALLALCFLLTGHATPVTDGLIKKRITDPEELVAAPDMPKPNYLETTADPVFGTPFVRVTDPGHQMGAGIVCAPRFCRHRYSSTQAWNADQSLLVITNGCNGMCFLEGRTFRPLFYRNVHDDCKWHPRDPELMVCVLPDGLSLWAPATDTWRVVHKPQDHFALEFGPYKGNLSRDGHRLVLRARDRADMLVAFVYDLQERSSYPDIPLVSLPGQNRYCGISASGRFVVCFQTLADGTETAHVLTPAGKQVQYWVDHHRPGHGDMTIDEDGRDIYVGISKADPDKWHVIKRRLDDGSVTVLGQAGHATHASLRNTSLPGWVFLSYEGTYRDVAGRHDWAPFHQEVVALRTDGSGQVRRIVQTRNAKVDYDSETHASPSPDGTLIIWSSNWGNLEESVADYVARVELP